MRPSSPIRAVCFLAPLIVAVAVGACGGHSTPGAPATPPEALSPQNSHPLALTPDDWPTYGGNAARSHYVASAPIGALQKTWTSPRLDGSVYGSPLVIGDELIAATEGDSVYALDGSSGRIRWQTKVGTPVNGSDLPCGDISPLGVTSTPVVDPASGLVFVVSETTGPRHELIGLDVRSGQIQVRRGIDPPGIDPRAQLQRGALALSQGRVYIPLGGLFGDCGRYNGYIIGVATDGNGPEDVYKTPDDSTGGIWSPAGPVIDETSAVYATTGNSESQGQPFDYGNSVLKLTPDLHLVDFFAPANWAQLNPADSDLGSSSPAILPGGLMAQVGKSGIAYLLRRDRLGGIGGQIASTGACAAYGGVAVKANVFVIGCPDGVRALSVNPGPSVGSPWRGPANVTGTPTIVGDTVLALDTDSGSLHALDMATGRDRAQVGVGALTRFASLAVSRGQAYVPTTTGVVAVALR